jgi:hypothetical protein
VSAAKLNSLLLHNYKLYVDSQNAEAKGGSSGREILVVIFRLRIYKGKNLTKGSNLSLLDSR